MSGASLDLGCMPTWAFRRNRRALTGASRNRLLSAPLGERFTGWLRGVSPEGWAATLAACASLSVSPVSQPANPRQGLCDLVSTFHSSIASRSASNAGIRYNGGLCGQRGARDTRAATGVVCLHRFKRQGRDHAWKVSCTLPSPLDIVNVSPSRWKSLISGKASK